MHVRKYDETRESNLDRIKKIVPCPKGAREHSVTSLGGKPSRDAGWDLQESGWTVGGSGLGCFGLNRPEWLQQTRLEGWTDPTGTSRVGHRHGGSRWNVEARSAAPDSYLTPGGDCGGSLVPELSGRPVQPCKDHGKQSTSGNSDPSGTSRVGRRHGGSRWNI
ncbi:hypothetical protein CRG98_003128 [Punica granatum]|uniref:Uncharacterized protein n=1 Tax=Punica granatum TaxID=22663 RepID=A0A2I0L701_PUNGR|nr:hypothetical protein CRG98_003128 [Punica granatum]